MLRGLRHIILQCVSLLKIFFVISLICFLPQVLFFVEHRRDGALKERLEQEFRLGIELLTQEMVQEVTHRAKASVGLLTHNTPTSSEGGIQVAMLQQKGITVNKVAYPAKRESSAVSDALTYMIYDHRIDAWRMPSKEAKEHMHALDTSFFNDIDLLLVDVQDSGMTYHAYVQLIMQALRAGAAAHKPIMVLDRPNMLGNKVEGPVKHDGLSQGVPLRYGMTIGELTQYCNSCLSDAKADVHVVAMQQYHRKVPSAANIPVQKGKEYAHSLCALLEHVAPIDVGAGSEYDRAAILLPSSIQFPERCWYQLQVHLQQMGVSCAQYRYYNKHKRRFCRGLGLQINDMQMVDSFAVALTVLDFFKKNGVRLSFDPLFDATLGTCKVREYLQEKVTREELCRSINQDLEHFYRKAFGSFLYHPLPQVALL